MIDPKQEITIMVSDRVGRSLNHQAITQNGPVVFLMRFGSDPVGWFEVVRTEWARDMGDLWKVTLRGIGEPA